MTIRRNLLLATLYFLSISVDTGAQVVGMREPFANVGLKIGGGFQALSGAPVITSPAVVAGVYARKGLGKFGARIEALGTYARYKTRYPASLYTLYAPGMDTLNKGDFETIYLGLPLLIDYQVNSGLQLLAGAQISYIASMTDKNNAYTAIYGPKSFIKPSDFSLVAGMELAVADMVKVGARLVKGVTDVNNSKYYLVPKTWTTTGIQITVSYKIL